MEQQQLLALIEKSKAGDRQAQEELVRAVQNRVYYHCKKMLKNEDDALDATQDVLIAMLTGLDKLREPAAFWGWVNGITANRCKHLLTQGTKEWQIPEDDEGNSLLDSLETLDDQVIPDKATDNAETQRLMMEIIDSLPPEQKMTVFFFYYDEMSVKEIAAAMEVSEGTVKSRLNYARKSIKEGVDKLEKKGTKLYSVSPLLVLAYLLRVGAQEQVLSPAAAGALVQRVLAASGAGAAAAGSAGTAAGSAAAGASTATSTAAGVAAAGAKAAAGVSAKLIAGVLAGLLALGGLGGGVYLATHQEPAGHASEREVETSEPTPEPTPEPPPYAAAYAEKVRELMATDAADQYLYDLVYIDGDDTPELLAMQEVPPATEWSFPLIYANLYTLTEEGELLPLCTDMSNQKGAPPAYYPGKNILLTGDSTGAYSASFYYRTSPGSEPEKIAQTRWDGDVMTGSLPEELEGPDESAEPLYGRMTGTEMLEQLEGPAPLEP